MEQFNKDYADPELRARVKAEGAFAEQFGATSTPAFMINGKVHIGWGSWSGFRSDVERELVEARKLEAQGIPVEQITEQRAHAVLEDAVLFGAYRDKVLRVTVEEPKKKKKKKK